MTSSMQTGERRWATSRRGGMTVLGKVSVPKPINLPSQRLENHGQNRDVEIVPKGTLSWGTKSPSSSSNPWGSSSTVTTADGGLSPSHLSARPSSGGSGTRPSTAGSDVNQEHGVSAWGTNSRPSSASGSMASNHNSMISLRPQSAETKHNTSQLSRFADTAPDSSSAWGSGTIDKWGPSSSKNGNFTLSSGDFPTLGLDKESSGRNSREGVTQGRPGSSSGEVSANKPVCDSIGDAPCYANPNPGNGNSWRTENAPFCEEARPGVEKWHSDHHPYPNPIMPQHYDAWHGPPVNNPSGMWYRGGPPGGPQFRPPAGRGGFPVEPFPYYRPQIAAPIANPLPVPGHAGPRELHPPIGDLYRPHLHDAYAHPGIPLRPGFYPAPGPCDGFYGPPPLGYGSINDREAPPMAAYSRFPAPSAHDSVNSRSMMSGFSSGSNAVSVEHMKQCGSDSRNHNPHVHNPQDCHRMVLLKQGDRLEDKDVVLHKLEDNTKPHGDFSSSGNTKNCKRDGMSAWHKESGEPGDPRVLAVSSDLKEKLGFIATVRAEGGLIDTEDGKNKLHDGQGNSSASGFRKMNQNMLRRNHHGKGRYASKDAEGWHERSDTTDDKESSVLRENEPLEAVVETIESTVVYLQEKDADSKSPAVGSNDTQFQRASMLELAKHRLKQREKEEEERSRDQKAKALAKLEELDRRTQVEASRKKSDSVAPPVQSKQGDGASSLVSDSNKASSSLLGPKPKAADNTLGKQKSSGEAVLELPRNAMKESSTRKVVQKYEKVECSSVAGNATVYFGEVPVEISPNVLAESVAHNRAPGSSKNMLKLEEAPTAASGTLDALDGRSVPERRNAKEVPVESCRSKTPEYELDPASLQPSHDSKQQKEKDSPAKAGKQWKSQHPKRLPRNPQQSRTEKPHGGDSVVWAPVRTHPKPEVTEDAVSKAPVEDPALFGKNDRQIHHNTRSKRAEIERYVPKQAAREPMQHESEEYESASADVDATLSKIGSASELRQEDVKPSKSGKSYGSWRKRESPEVTQSPALNHPDRNVRDADDGNSFAVSEIAKDTNAGFRGRRHPANPEQNPADAIFASRDKNSVAQWQPKSQPKGPNQRGRGPDPNSSSEAGTLDHLPPQKASQESGRSRKNPLNRGRFNKPGEPSSSEISRLPESEWNDLKPTSGSKDRFKSNPHYEYQPVGPQRDSDAPRERAAKEKGHGFSRRGSAYRQEVATRADADAM